MCLYIYKPTYIHNLQHASICVTVGTVGSSLFSQVQAVIAVIA